MLVFVDGRYVAFTGMTGLLDLTTGEQVQGPEVPPLETVGYNLLVLFRRNMMACRKLQEQEA